MSVRGWGTGLAIILLVSAARAQDSGQDDLDSARLLVAQGLLRKAERLLEPLAAPGASGQVALERTDHARLLLGNIAFERGHYATAEARYEAVLSRADVSAGLKEATRSNLDRCQGLLARRAVLEAAARQLVLAVAVVALAGGAACFAAGVRAARAPTAR